MQNLRWNSIFIRNHRNIRKGEITSVDECDQLNESIEKCPGIRIRVNHYRKYISQVQYICSFNSRAWARFSAAGRLTFTNMQFSMRLHARERERAREREGWNDNTRATYKHRWWDNAKWILGILLCFVIAFSNIKFSRCTHAIHNACDAPIENGAVERSRKFFSQ